MGEEKVLVMRLSIIIFEINCNNITVKFPESSLRL